MGNALPCSRVTIMCYDQNGSPYWKAGNWSRRHSLNIFLGYILRLEPFAIACFLSDGEGIWRAEKWRSNIGEWAWLRPSGFFSTETTELTFFLVYCFCWGIWGISIYVRISEAVMAKNFGTEAYEFIRIGRKEISNSEICTTKTHFNKFDGISW